MEDVALELKKEIISPSLLSLLESLMKEESLESFFLVGGTALALILGHRKSVDIDLFTTQMFDSQLLLRSLEQKFGLTNTSHEKNTISGYIDNIKVEFLTHEYDLIEPISVIDGIRIAGLKELAALKLNAIAGRGSRKDFWDISSLLDYYSIDEMIGFFEKKYPSANIWHLIRSLTYFTDADKEEIEIASTKDISWEQVKTKILNALRDYQR